jgi:hypothetical protein
VKPTIISIGRSGQRGCAKAGAASKAPAEAKRLRRCIFMTFSPQCFFQAIRREAFFA